MGTEAYLGEISMFGGNFNIRGTAYCAGQLLAISQNTALFSLLGTTYGGDGRTTFALPDLRGRSPIAPGNGPGLPSYTLGQRGGSAWSVMNLSEMPSHSHAATTTTATTIGVSTTEGSETNIDGHYLANHPNAFNEDPTPGASMDGATAASTTTIGNSGGNQAQYNMQPFLAINFLIYITGIFPSRN